MTPIDRGGMRFEFDGHQPETCELLSQYVSLLPGRKYELKTHFRTRGIAPESGLNWIILANHKVSASFPSFSSDSDVEQIASFESPREPAPVQLVLAYARRPGTTRIEGELRIESVSLQLLPGGEAH